MNSLPGIKNLSSAGEPGTIRGGKPGKNSGNDIFQSILNSIGRENRGSWISNLYADNNTGGSSKTGFSSTLKNMAANVGISGKRPSNSLSKNKSNPEDLIVPVSLQNQLVSFLEKQGFALKDINQVISESKNSKGSIQLDKLLEGLSGINSADANPGKMLVTSFKDSFSSFLNEQGIDPGKYGNFFTGIRNKNAALADNINDLLSNNSKNSSFIESSRVPGAEEILFKMGIGAGDVKKIMEKSLNGNGELEISRLSAELNRLLESPLSESDLVSIFSKNNVTVNKRLFNTADQKTGTNNLLSDSGRFLSGDVQKELKQNIEAMLKENGISEEDISSFLKRFDSALAKIKLEGRSDSGKTDPADHKKLSMLEGEGKIISSVTGDSLKDDISAFLKNKGASDRDIKSFMDSFHLDLKKTEIGQNENNLKSALLNEKVSGYLKNDQALPASDQGNLKLNLTELIKLAEKKNSAELHVKSNEGNPEPGTSAKNSSAVKEGSGFSNRGTPDLAGINGIQEKEIKNIGKASQSNTTMNLPQPLPKIVDRMILMLRTGEYQSRLHITPPDLGKLDIDLTIKNGHIHANLSTENAAVKEIIEANLNHLKNQLNSQGYTVERFDVMVNLDNGERRDSSTWAEGRNNRNSGRNTGSKPGTGGEILASAPAGKDPTGDSQIDVHV